jgi:hypothetical protein
MITRTSFDQEFTITQEGDEVRITTLVGKEELNQVINATPPYVIVFDRKNNNFEAYPVGTDGSKEFVTIVNEVMKSEVRQ